jgi:putative ABC transport system substrate-binding protein
VENIAAARPPEPYSSAHLSRYDAMSWVKGTSMRRRQFLGAIGGLTTWPIAVRAQQAGRTYRVALLAPAQIGAVDERRKSIIDGLAARGFVVGQNLVVEMRSADGKLERLSELAAALKASKIDAIVTFGYPAALAAKNSAQGVPIVVTGSGDPVATGLADGLARPGGYLTGLTEMSTELSAKRLEILKDAVPGLRRVAMLWNTADLGMSMRYKSAETAAKVLNVSVQALGVREPNDFDDAFAAMTRSLPDAILMVSDALTNLNRKRVIDFANANKLPAIYELSALVREGGLLSYGASQSAMGERAADFIARILRGARPAELPLEQPLKFEMLINLKTAKSLGLTIPAQLVARADEVIE